MANPIKAILFIKTAGYRHASIPALVAGLQSLFAAPSQLYATEDASELSSRLPAVDLLILGNNTGDFLTEPGEKEAVHAFVDRGGAIVGVHACTSGEKGWTWYGETLGAVFDGHPHPQWGLIRIHDESHFITNDLARPSKSPRPKEAPPCPAKLLADVCPPSFPWFDEWYNFKSYQGKNDTRRELITVDEASYEGGTAGGHHPLAWTQEVGDKRSRVFYTALGHFDEAFSDPWFMEMLARGIYWATRREEEFSAHLIAQIANDEH